MAWFWNRQRGEDERHRSWEDDLIASGQVELERDRKRFRLQLMRWKTWISCGTMEMGRILVLEMLFSENSATRAIKGKNGKDFKEDHRVESNSSF